MVAGAIEGIGIMQGRLLPPVAGRLQAFPGPRWGDEFRLARECGLDAVEMIFDLDGIEENPLNSESGIRRISELAGTFDIAVRSVCADYFMARPFHRVADRDRDESMEVLERLTRRCQQIGIRHIVIPLVDQAEIRTDAELGQASGALLGVLERTDGCDVEYTLEMSLPADRIGAFLAEAGHPRLKVNYDTGNSTALGYDLASEIERLHPWIVSVHVKDREVAGGSRLLGEGDTDFDGAFRMLASTGYRGLLILQAQRGSDEMATARRHLRFVRDQVARHFACAERQRS
jgi:hexulose-6-phosphate isomerase